MDVCVSVCFWWWGLPRVQVLQILPCKYTQHIFLFVKCEVTHNIVLSVIQKIIFVQDQKAKVRDE